jgi:hypothetical protein
MIPTLSAQSAPAGSRPVAVTTARACHARVLVLAEMTLQGDEDVIPSLFSNLVAPGRAVQA